MFDPALAPQMTDQSKQSTDLASLIGQQLPDSIVSATDNFDVAFHKLQGFQAILFFYPQNDLPGITQLAKDIASQYPVLKQVQTCVFGVCSESVAANQNFKDKLGLPFQLISDENSIMANWLNSVIKPSLSTDKITTLDRSTLLIDKNGKIVRAWSNPDIRGHITEVVEAAHRLAEGLIDEAPVLNLGEGQAQLVADLADVLEI